MIIPHERHCCQPLTCCCCCARSWPRSYAFCCQTVLIFLAPMPVVILHEELIFKKLCENRVNQLSVWNWSWFYVFASPAAAVWFVPVLGMVLHRTHEGSVECICACNLFFGVACSQEETISDRKSHDSIISSLFHSACANPASPGSNERETSCRGGYARAHWKAGW